MKRYKAKFAIFTSFIIVLLFSTYGFAQENDVDNYKIIFKFKTIKQADNSRLLEVRFIGQNRKNKKDKIPVYGAEIAFINYTDVEKVQLGTYKTSNEGIAQLTLAENHQYLIDESGYINLTAHFDGNDAIGEQDAEISVKDLHLELDLKEIDSIKTVFVNAYTADIFGKEIPVNDVDIIKIHNVISGQANNFGIETSWTINGSVSHFGHMHYRQNRYRAVIWIIPIDGYWKIQNIEMLDEERLL